jgi:AraC-like DNA-binding protein
MQARRFERLTDIAHDLGYTDQSHFIKDIKEFTGSTPKDLSHAVQECTEMRRHQTFVRQSQFLRHLPTLNSYYSVVKAAIVGFERNSPASP